ncbi:hypothetical protein [Helicobacter sp. MIT 14-3879]|uniref:hypothetical protein n=1 Tax=Helicobacter sp. MIT 14-3879 TaxID=2040649 RepID=UPI000E1F9F33|nr:hypothetical protein [Helicobacter sp. MIT 14-3879]RDU62272.1 hypothetical protein CQA44_07200 [Helicobacter sp. MIT 14-3879]
MLDFIKKYKSEVFISFIFGVFCIFGMLDLLNRNASIYIESNFNFALTNAGIIAGLKIICGILPFSSGISDILDKIFNFFFLANILIGIEYILLMINKIFIFKILIIALFFIRFISNFKTIATKILVILLFFNPGLNIYINLIKIISNEANLQIDSKIDSEIQGIKKMLGIVEMPKVDLEFNDSRSTSQKIIGEIGLFTQKFSDSTKAITEAITSPIDSTKEVIDATKQKIYKSISFIASSLDLVLKLTIQYMLNIFFLYFIMPIIYFYILYRVVSSRS